MYQSAISAVLRLAALYESTSSSSHAMLRAGAGAPAAGRRIGRSLCAGAGELEPVHSTSAGASSIGRMEREQIAIDAFGQAIGVRQLAQAFPA